MNSTGREARKMKNVINELKELMLNIGVKESIVNEIDPTMPLAGLVMDSLAYSAFLVAVEERYGIKIVDRYALKLKSLNDFMNFINPGS
jgi:acyl carrier protein